MPLLSKNFTSGEVLLTLVISGPDKVNNDDAIKVVEEAIKNLQSIVTGLRKLRN